MSKAAGDLLSHFEAKEVEGSPPPPNWNVPPTQDVPIVAERLDEGSHVEARPNQDNPARPRRKQP
jgi:putative SOS response-associated peptidase YedK